MNELTVIEFEPLVKQSGLEKAEQYAAVFSPFMINLKQLSDKAATVNHEAPTPVDAKIAREVRLAIAKNRTASEKVKDSNKAALITEGNLIQGLYNVIANASKLSEADLDAVEKFAENKEKERKVVLAIERDGMFAEYGTDLTGYDLGAMADNVFSDLLESQKLLHEKRIADVARLEAERIAAEKAELERQAALKAENERLLAETQAAAKLLDKERKAAAAKLASEHAEATRLAKIEKDKADALATENAAKLAAIEAENNRVRQKAAAELQAANEAAEKAKAELKAKKDEADRIEREKLSAEKLAAKSPVKVKLKTAVTSLVLELPESEITADILTKFTAFKNWALQQIETLQNDIPDTVG